MQRLRPASTAAKQAGINHIWQALSAKYQAAEPRRFDLHELAFLLEVFLTVFAPLGVGLKAAATFGWPSLSQLTALFATALLAWLFWDLFQSVRCRWSKYAEYFAGKLDEDGTFMFCPSCDYDLKGCQRPRFKCPECGLETWQLELEEI